jgi:hypothetical protein
LNLTPVILESPFAGNVKLNIAYARACLRDSLLRGEAPIASHLLYTQPGVLDDNDPDERALGINAGLAWGCEAKRTVVYTDLGISRGMRYGIERANKEGRPVEDRTLSPTILRPILKKYEKPAKKTKKLVRAKRRKRNK